MSFEVSAANMRRAKKNSHTPKVRKQCVRTRKERKIDELCVECKAEPTLKGSVFGQKCFDEVEAHNMKLRSNVLYRLMQSGKVGRIRTGKRQGPKYG